MNIQQLSPHEFRQKLAGLIDPLKKVDEYEVGAMKDEAVRFISILPEIFSDDLDRKTLWERIGNGLKNSIAKSGGDFEAFINNAIEFIKADPGKVASNDNLEMFLASSLTRPEEWRQQFLRIIETRYFLLIVKARAQWNEKKGGK